MPLLLASGVLIPMEAAPGWLWAVSRLNPLTYVLDAESDLFAGELTSPAVLLGTGVSLALTAVALVWGARAFRPNPCLTDTLNPHGTALHRGHGRAASPSSTAGWCVRAVTRYRVIGFAGVVENSTPRKFTSCSQRGTGAGITDLNERTAGLGSSRWLGETFRWGKLKMTLRMVFNREDLQRVRIRHQADPLWELTLSLLRIQERSVARRYAPWHRDVRLRLLGSERMKQSLGMLCTLVPPRGDFPDFLTPHEPVTELDAGCELIACTPRNFLRRDLKTAFAHRSIPGWVMDLPKDPKRIGSVVRAVRQAHDFLIAPHWHELRATVAADASARVHLLAREGVGKLLATLPGIVGWDGRVLEIAYPESRTVALKGRGLTLLPVHFCADKPVTFLDPELPPVLVYRAASGVAGKSAGNATPQLVHALGRTRTECLKLLGTPRSTSALAAELGTSIGTASKQATILRKAGLVASTREGGAVLHRLTPLGADLLAGRELPDA